MIDDWQAQADRLRGARSSTRQRTRSRADETAAVDRLAALAAKRAGQGDREALRFLYIRYADNVYRYVRTVVRDDHEAEDVMQQVFAKLPQALARYEQRDTPFTAWILRLAHNAAVDNMRMRRIRPTADVQAADDGVDDLAGDRVRDVRIALEALPDEQREVIVLRHVMGLTPGEIARRLGRSESSIHGLHHRGRRALQAELRRLERGPSTIHARIAA
jgi:RNA polymerase sigma-70 factor (ECF subfamily)